jgi:hypothetical protein
MPPIPKLIVPISTIFMVVFPLIMNSKQSQGAQGTLSYTLPAGTSPRDRYFRDLACYVFDGISGAYNKNCRTELSGVLDMSQIPPAAAESLDRLFKPVQSGTELVDLRSWWNQWSSPLRSLRGQETLIPTSLEDFERLHEYKNWPREVIKKSRVKSKTRVIYRSPGDSHAISISETRDSVTGDLESKVIETEVVIERSDHSGNFDFFAYDADGQLSPTAWFPSGEKTLPGICMSCHHSPTSGTFKRSGR